MWRYLSTTGAAIAPRRARLYSITTTINPIVVKVCPVVHTVVSSHFWQWYYAAATAIPMGTIFHPSPSSKTDFSYFVCWTKHFLPKKSCWLLWHLIFSIDTFNWCQFWYYPITICQKNKKIWLVCHWIHINWRSTPFVFHHCIIMIINTFFHELLPWGGQPKFEFVLKLDRARLRGSNLISPIIMER